MKQRITCKCSHYKVKNEHAAVIVSFSGAARTESVCSKASFHFATRHSSRSVSQSHYQTSVKQTCLVVAPLRKCSIVTGGTSFLIHLKKVQSHVGGKLEFETLFYSCCKVSTKHRLGVLFRIQKPSKAHPGVWNLIGWATDEWRGKFTINGDASVEKYSRWLGWIMAVNLRKSKVCTAVEETEIKSILAAMNTTEIVVEIKSEKNSGPYGIWSEHSNKRVLDHNRI